MQSPKSPGSKDAPAPKDAVSGNWVDDFAPRPWRAYLRLMRADRPIGAWLLLIPCWWGLSLGAVNGFSGFVLVYYAMLFAIGAFVMRGAGCAYNDIVDRDYDAKVERTALRPIPSGQITVNAAWLTLAALCAAGLIVLLQFNLPTILLGISSLALIAIYPFMKRITYWPQAWLGLTFNWGALMGYCAVSGRVSPAAIAIYAAGFFWTLAYDTIYAHQDKDDDALIGVKSTALKLGNASNVWIAGFFTMTILLFAAAGALTNSGPVYFIALTPAAAHFSWQFRNLDINDSTNCLRIFRANREAGLLLLASPICEALLRLI